MPGFTNLWPLRRPGAATMRHAGTDSGPLELLSCRVRVAQRSKDLLPTRITGKGALYVGQVQPPDADAAIKLASRKFERLMRSARAVVAARPIMPR